MRITVVLAVAFMALACSRGSESMADSPRMGTAPELTGRWTLSAGEASCRLELRAEPVDLRSGDLSFPAHAVALGEGCDAVDGARLIAGWRPAPLGLALASADGRTLAEFERHGDQQYVAPAGRDRPAWTITRRPG